MCCAPMSGRFILIPAHYVRSDEYFIFYFILFHFVHKSKTYVYANTHIYCVAVAVVGVGFFLHFSFTYLFRLSLSLSVISCIIVLWFLSRTYSSTHNIQCFRLVVVTICFCFDFLARENINTIIYPNTLTHTHWFFMFSLYRPHFSRCLRFSFIFFVSLD